MTKAIRRHCNFALRYLGGLYQSFPTWTHPLFLTPTQAASRKVFFPVFFNAVSGEVCKLSNYCVLCWHYQKADCTFCFTLILSHPLYLISIKSQPACSYIGNQTGEHCHSYSHRRLYLMFIGPQSYKLHVPQQETLQKSALQEAWPGPASLEALHPCVYAG